MAALPDVLGCRALRRTVQVRLGPIPRYRGTVARLHAHLRGLATAVHEISGLAIKGTSYLGTNPHFSLQLKKHLILKIDKFSFWTYRFRN